MLTGFIVLGVLGAALTLVLHGLSHVFVAWQAGCTITEFCPWPVKREGRWHFGWMAFKNGPKGAPPAKAFLSAPLKKASILLVVWLLLGLFLFRPLLALAFWELTDILNWLQGYLRRSKNDGGRYRMLQ